MPEWLLKWIINMAAAWLIKKIGHTETAQHVEDVLLKYTPPPPHRPSPGEIMNPHKTYQLQD